MDKNIYLHNKVQKKKERRRMEFRISVASIITAMLNFFILYAVTYDLGISCVLTGIFGIFNIMTLIKVTGVYDGTN
jgi:hypothetical protein